MAGAFPAGVSTAIDGLLDRPWVRACGRWPARISRPDEGVCSTPCSCRPARRRRLLVVRSGPDPLCRGRGFPIGPISRRGDDYAQLLAQACGRRAGTDIDKWKGEWTGLMRTRDGAAVKTLLNNFDLEDTALTPGGRELPVGLWGLRLQRARRSLADLRGRDQPAAAPGETCIAPWPRGRLLSAPCRGRTCLSLKSGRLTR